MKKLQLLSVGLLLLLSTPVQAAGESDQYADLDPISQHYIKHVVERAKKGIEYAKSQGSGGQKPPNFLLSWGGWIAASVLGVVDTNLRLTEQERDLLQNSPCLRVDALILEGWMERARLEKMRALESGNASAIYALVQLQRYLNDRFKALLEGAYDPTFKDRSEGKLYAFDPLPYWCCPAREGEDAVACKEVSTSEEGISCTYNQGILSKRVSTCVERGCTYNAQNSSQGNTQNSAQELYCPYSTDYFPPTAAGYGCDLSILDRYKDKTPEEVKKEYDALKGLVQDRDQYIEDSGSLRGAVENVSELLGLSLPDLENFQKGNSRNRQHKTLSGCIPPEQQWPPGLAAFSERGPFSIKPSDSAVLTRLNDLWMSWGNRRVAPDYLKYSSELDPGENKNRQKERETNFFALAYLPAMASARSYLQNVSAVQLGEMSFAIPKASDSPSRFLEAFGSLQEQVSTFVQSSQGNAKGMRGFTRNFAYFLRRSCIFRPCNIALDKILKIVFSDECFPYAEGLSEGGNPAEDCENSL